jgi:hypothetical protein
MDEYIKRNALLNTIMKKYCDKCPGGYCCEECHHWCKVADIIKLVQKAPAFQQGGKKKARSVR